MLVALGFRAYNETQIQKLPPKSPAARARVAQKPMFKKPLRTRPGHP